jgi:hypothetical protein
LFFLAKNLGAQEEVTLTELSRTKKTVALNIGELEGITTGELAKFVVHAESSNQKYNIVAEAEAVKITAHQSFWSIKQLNIPESLVKNQKVYLLRTKNLLSGRRKLKKKNQSIIFSSDQEELTKPIKDTLLDNYERGFPKELIKKQQYQKNSESMIVTQRAFDHDAEAFSLQRLEVAELPPDLDELLEEDSPAGWDKKSEQDEVANERLTEFDFDPKFESLLKKQIQKKGKSSIKNSLDLDVVTDPDESQLYTLKARPELQAPDQEDIDQAYDQFLAENITKEFIDKANDPSFNLQDQMVEENQMVDEGLLRMRRTHQTILEEHQGNHKKRQQISALAAQRIKERGGQWSDDFSDEQLRQFIEDNGLQKEVVRQDFFAQNELNDNKVSLKGWLDLFDHTSLEDTANRGFSLGLGLEYEYFLSRLFTELKKWTAAINYGLASSAYDVGNKNAASKERSIGLIGRYYFRNFPTTINEYNAWWGLGFKKGTARLFNEELVLGESLTYLVLPHLEIGVEYRYPKGQGLSIDQWGYGFQSTVSYQSLKFDRNNTIVAAKTNSSHYNSLKIEVGMSFYF